MIGTIIKKHRLDQNMSQESLCAGICAVSYLSKIENGQAKASHEILVLLFNRLGLPFPETLGEIEKFEAEIYEAIQTLLLGEKEEATKQHHALLINEGVFIASPLAIDWLILELYFAIDKRDYAEVSEKLADLETYAKHFSSNQRYHTNMLKGLVAVHEVSFDAALDAFIQAMHIRRDGLIIAQLAMTYFYKGDYVSAITYGDEAYTTLMDVGYLNVAIEVSGIVATAYSNLEQIEKALHVYKRQLNLTRSSGQTMVRYSVNYNIGATYLLMGDFDNARLYLNQAIDSLGPDDIWRTYYLYQKLVLCYIGLGQLAEARSWLEKLEAHLATSEGKPDSSMIQSIKWLGHYKHHDDPIQEPGYLDDLKTTFDLSKRDSHYGFQLFYGQYLAEAYKANRRYKDALMLMESLKLSC